MVDIKYVIAEIDKQEGHDGPWSLTWSILYKWNGR